METLGEFETERDEWKLAVTGAVEREVRIGPGDLESLSPETVTEDFACADGWVAEDLTWRGVRVGNLLALAGPTGESEFALVEARDAGYACGFSLARLSEALLAVELGGDPLPAERGGPVRLVPTDGSDCWESVKRVCRIDVRETDPAEEDRARDLALSGIE